MHLKKTLLSLFLATSLLLTGCFQVIEEINLRTDGSGTASLTINLSQSKSKVASIMLMDSINGYKVPSQQKIKQEMAAALNFLRQSPGISDVKGVTDFNNYVATITFSFKNAGNLSNLSRTILNRMKIRASDQSSYSYNAQLREFKRNYQHVASARSEYARLKPADKAVFKDATYTAVYRFEHVVSSVSNRQAAISRSGKAVMLRTGILALIDGKANISNTIQLKK